jgi:hypothetical protein
MIVFTRCFTGKIMNMPVAHILRPLGASVIAVGMTIIIRGNPLILMLMPWSIRGGRGNSPHYMAMTIIHLSIDCIRMDVVVRILTFFFTILFSHVNLLYKTCLIYFMIWEKSCYVP